MILKYQYANFNYNYKEINEYETSKIYNCKSFDKKLNRDINASININNKEK